MTTLQTVLEETTKLNHSIRRLLRLSTYNKYDDLSGLDMNLMDPEQILVRDELRLVMDKLADVEDLITYLNSPIQEVSRLHRNSQGKYETASGRYYCCGSRIEALVTDEYHDGPYWTRTSVEHDGEDYYLVGNKDVSMNGLTVRVRKPLC